MNSGRENIIATWMVTDEANEASEFPQAGMNSSSKKFQEIYWKCIICFFVTSYRLNNESRHILFVNKLTNPNINGLDVYGLLRKMDVEIAIVPITHRLGTLRAKAWNNQFYILDIISALSKSSDYKTVTILDSDCVWVRSADELIQDINLRGILTLCIPYALDLKVNGGSREDMRLAAFTLYGKSFNRNPYYCGGEIFSATLERVNDINCLAKIMWPRLVNGDINTIPITEEGHFLSIIYHLLDIPIGTADPHIKRMWTALRLKNVSWEDINSSRCVWHLPEEKNVGFTKLFLAAKDKNSWLWTVQEKDIRLKIAKTMGLPERTFIQWVRKFRTRFRLKVQRKLGI